MFNNIGSKIRGLAIGGFVIGALVSVIFGIVLLSIDATITGLIYLFIGPVVSWLSSLLLYGLGQLIDDTAIIREATVAMQSGNYEVSFGDNSSAVSKNQDESDLGFCTNCGSPRVDIGAFCSSCGHSFYE